MRSGPPRTPRDRRPGLPAAGVGRPAADGAATKRSRENPDLFFLL